MRGDEAMQRRPAQTGRAANLVKTNVKTLLNATTPRACVCRWTDGDTMKGQRPLAVIRSGAVGKVATMGVTELGE